MTPPAMGWTGGPKTQTLKRKVERSYQEYEPGRRGHVYKEKNNQELKEIKTLPIPEEKALSKEL